MMAIIKKSSLVLFLTIIFLNFMVIKTQGGDIWVTSQELEALPTEGAAWKNLVAGATTSTVNPDLSNQNDYTDVYTLAKALVYARTKDAKYANEVRQTLNNLVRNHPLSTSVNWDWLGILRSLGSYVIAADLIDLKNFDRSFDQNIWRPWLSGARFAVTENGRGSVVSAQETRPNNFGTHASASRIAADLYLDDQKDLAQAIRVFKGWLGDRESYSGFKYGDLSWQADKKNPVGINPKGASIAGKNVDGVLPDDQRRGGSFSWPPPQENYVWEAMQGVVAAAEMLHRAGYPAFEWEDRAVLRAVQWLHSTTFSGGKNYPAGGDDAWQVWIINKRYGTNYPQKVSVNPGKMVGWTDWSHQLTNSPPFARFVVEPEHPTTSSPVKFNASQAEDANGTIESYEWNFGGGETASGMIVSHLFTEPGSYIIRLKVTDNDGLTHSVSQTIQVTDDNATVKVLPLTLQGKRLPEEATVKVNIRKLLGSSDKATLSMTVYDADIIDEGILMINGHDPIQLFGDQAKWKNDRKVVDVSFSTPADWWDDGANTLRFVHTRTGGYRVDRVSVDFGSTSPSFPVVLQGKDLPEELTVEMNASKPTAADSTAVLILSVFDADTVDEGTLHINGLGPIQLFGDQASWKNDRKVLDVAFTTPADWWEDGVNTLRFTHTRTGGYRVNNAFVVFDSPTETEVEVPTKSKALTSTAEINEDKDMTEPDRVEHEDYSNEPVSWTVYEDAEDLTTNGWVAYNQGQVKNISGGAIGGQRAIEIVGDIKTDVFRLGKDDGTDWDNDEEFFAQFSVAINDPGAGAIYFQLNTSGGVKYLVYTTALTTQGDDPDLIYFDLGDIVDGQWHTVRRHLVEDLKTRFPSLDILKVKNLFVYGSLTLDNVMLLDFAALRKQTM